MRSLAASSCASRFLSALFSACAIHSYTHHITSHIRTSHHANILPARSKQLTKCVRFWYDSTLGHTPHTAGLLTAIFSTCARDLVQATCMNRTVAGTCTGVDQTFTLMSSARCSANRPSRRSSSSTCQVVTHHSSQTYVTRIHHLTLTYVLLVHHVGVSCALRHTADFSFVRDHADEPCAGLNGMQLAGWHEACRMKMCGCVHVSTCTPCLRACAPQEPPSAVVPAATCSQVSNAGSENHQQVSPAARALHLNTCLKCGHAVDPLR